ncbi:MAG: hypothetical protein KAT04_11880 [Methylococcales bacterium]|nr:hypothetical protein [Methylococcales bacterium]
MIKNYIHRLNNTAIPVRNTKVASLNIVFLILVALLIGFSSAIKADCSSYSGQITINEYNFIDNHVELKVLNSSLVSNSSNFNGWTLTIFNEQGKSFTKNVSSIYSSTENSCGTDSTYIDIPFDASEIPDIANTVLADSTNNIIDVFRVSKNTPLVSLYSGYNSCDITTLPYPTDAPQVIGSEQKDYSRWPVDGTGVWSILTNSGSNSESSLCTDNDGSGLDASNFNCLELGASNPATKQIYTKLVNTPFLLNIVALKNGVIDKKYKKSVTVDIIDPLTSGIITSQSVSFSGTGQQELSFTINDPNRRLMCQVTQVGKTTIIQTTDNFSVRPIEFNPVSSNLNNTTTTGAPSAKAGSLFTLNATAIANYDGTPLIDNTKIEPHINAVATGTLTGSFSPADTSTGTATGTSFSYDEVGAFRFAAEGVYDNSFTAIDQPDDCTAGFSNTFVDGQKIGCSFGNQAATNYFGRFTPDRFSFISSAITPACVAGDYSYMDETFAISYAVEARNASDVLTQNYHYQAIASENYVKATDIAISAEYIPSGASTSQDLSSRISMIYNPSLWVNGRYQVSNADAVFSRIATVDGAYDNLDIGLKVVDSDGIVLSAPDMLSSDNTNLACTALTCLENKLGSTNIRFGRLNMANSHGSELLPLATPLFTEYFNGTFFVANSDDSCTNINLAQLQFNAGASPVTIGSGSSTASIANAPLSLGQAGLSFSSPGAGNTGFIDISSDIFIASFPWLSFDWNDDGIYDDAPTARATFGVYKGNNKQIYFREVY